MIRAILDLEEEIMVFNNETIKFHSVIIETIHLSEQTLFQPMIFHKLRAITP